MRIQARTAVLVLFFCIILGYSSFLLGEQIGEGRPVNREQIFLIFALFILIATVLTARRIEKRRNVCSQPPAAVSTTRKARIRRRSASMRADFKQYTYELSLWLAGLGYSPDLDDDEASIWDWSFRRRVFVGAYEEDKRRALEHFFGYSYELIEETHPAIWKLLNADIEGGPRVDPLQILSAIRLDPSVACVSRHLTLS